MKIRIVHPTTYTDINLWTVYEHPQTLIPTLFKTSIQQTLVLGFQDSHSTGLKKELESIFNTVIELEDLGYWDNVVNSDGFILHPFSKERIRICE